jgi:YVTN family beta-propeller protein
MVKLGPAALFILSACQPGAGTGPVEGTVIVCNQKGGSVWLIDAKSGTVAHKIEAGVGPHEAAVSPDGKQALVTIYGDGTSVGRSLMVIDVPSGQIAKTIDPGEYTLPHGVTFLGADRALVTSETTQNLVLVDLKAGKVARTMSTGAPGSHMLALPRAGDYAYSGNIPEGTVTKLEVASGKSLGKAKLGPGSGGIGVSPDGTRVVTANRGDGSVSLVDTESLKVLEPVKVGGVPYRAAFSADGRQVLVPNPEQGKLHVFSLADFSKPKSIDLAAGERIAVKGGPPHPMGTGIFLHPDGRHALVSILNADSVAVVDLDRAKTVAVLPTGPNPDGVAWTPIAVTAASGATQS